MNRNLWLLLLWSVKGRLKRFRKQLRQPRYLLAFLAGCAYLLGVTVWVLLPRVGRSSNDGMPFDFALGEAAVTVRVLLALAAALAVTFAWIMLRAQPRLTLSSAEIHTLLPAPLSRRQILAFALLRNQPLVWLSALLFSVIRGNFLGLPVLWAVITLVDWHLKGLTLWKTRWKQSPPAPAWAARGVVTGLFLLFWGAIAVRLVDFWPVLGEVVTALGQRNMEAVRDLGPELPVLLAAAFQGAAPDQIAGGVLTPFLWATAPLLPASMVGWGALLGGGLFLLALLGLHYLWVVGSDARFEDTVLEAARKMERKRGGRRDRAKGEARRRHPFHLPPRGLPELAIVWKNLLLVTRLPLRRVLMVCMVMLVLLHFAAARFGTQVDFIPIVTGLVVCLLLVFPGLTGMMFRLDLRCELQHVELARTWPVRGWRLVLAEIAVPAGITISVALLGLLALLAVTLGTSQGWEALTPWRVLVAMGTAMPPVVGLAALSSVVLNLATLLLPTWIPLGLRSRRGGPANAGTAAVIFLGHALALLVALLPAGLLAALATALLGWVGLPTPFLVLTAGGVVGLVLLAEAGVLAVLAGRRWDGLDPSRELLSE